MSGEAHRGEAGSPTGRWHGSVGWLWRSSSGEGEESRRRRKKKSKKKEKERRAKTEGGEGEEEEEEISRLIEENGLEEGEFWERVAVSGGEEMQGGVDMGQKSRKRGNSRGLTAQEQDLYLEDEEPELVAGDGGGGLSDEELDDSTEEEYHAEPQSFRRRKGGRSERGKKLMETFKEEAVKPSIALSRWGKAVLDSKQMKRLAEKRRQGEAQLKRIRNQFVTSDEFVEMVDRAFEECDIDGNGSIEKAELYAGILLLYHNLNRIPWGGRKPPPSKEHVFNIMEKYDFNEDETLDREEFLALCQDLCHNVALDVSKRIFLVLFVFPVLALPLKRSIEDFFGAVGLHPLRNFFVSIPDHIFTSAAVALMITALPYLEQKLPAIRRFTWDAISDITQSEKVKEFHQKRHRKVVSLKAAKTARDKARKS